MSDEGFEIKSGNDYHQDVVDVSAYVPPACSSAQLKLKFSIEQTDFRNFIHQS